VASFSMCIVMSRGRVRCLFCSTIEVCIFSDRRADKGSPVSGDEGPNIALLEMQTSPSSKVIQCRCIVFMAPFTHCFTSNPVSHMPCRNWEVGRGATIRNSSIGCNRARHCCLYSSSPRRKSIARSPRSKALRKVKRVPI